MPNSTFQPEVLSRLGRALTVLALLALARDGLTREVDQKVAQAPQEREALRSFLETTVAASNSFEDRYAAQVWLVDMNNRLERFVDDPEHRLQLQQQIHATAVRSGLAPELVLAVIEVESHFDRFALSSAGAQGLMQVMPFWKDEIGRPDDNLTNNTTNLDYGCRILQFYLEREKGGLHRALAAYNGSAGSRVYSNKVEAAWREHWQTEPLSWEP
jgi:soluble lytic murein transglycosylase-like protein